MLIYFYNEAVLTITSLYLQLVKILSFRYSRYLCYILLIKKLVVYQKMKKTKKRSGNDGYFYKTDYFQDEIKIIKYF